jgi:hypothetical protein
MTNSVLWGLAACLALCLAPHAPAEFDKTELLGAWEANWALISDLEIQYEQTNLGRPDLVEQGLISRIEYVFRRADDAYYCQETQPGRPSVQTSFDCASGTGRMAGPPHNGWIGSRNYGAAGASTWMANLLRSPCPGATAGYLPNLDLASLLTDERASARSDLEMIDGTPAVAVDQRVGEVVRLTVWLDPARGAAPLRWIRYRMDGAMSAAVDLLDYIQIAGAWLPRRIELTYGPGAHEGLRTVQRVLTDASGGPAIYVNRGLDAAACLVKFDTGTAVLNEDTGDIWIVSDHAKNISGMVDQICKATAGLSFHKPTHMPAAHKVGLGVLACVGLMAGFAWRASHLR